ncbi:hypothetical protein MHEI_28720 [Mycobacterium heidelbergense]|nr:hypothetical protein MHEI_28720 [Mycobacterium heidelbergense]
MLTPGGSEPLSAFINAALAESSGKSPLSVKPLPLRVIDSGANDSLGVPELLDDAGAGSPAAGRDRSKAP